MSWGVLPWVYLVWNSLGFLDLSGYFFSHFRGVFDCYLIKYFLVFFLFVFFWDNYDSNAGAFNIVPEVSGVVLISFYSFLFFLFVSFISTIPSPTSLILFSVSVILLLVFSRVFLILVIALLIIDWLSFIYSRSLLNISYYSQSLSLVYLFVTTSCFLGFGSSLLSLFWILFQVDSLSPPVLFGLVDFYHVPSLAGYFSVFSFCSAFWVWGALSSSWKVVIPFICGFFSMWVGLDQWLVKASWLGELVSVFWWVELYFFSLECNEVFSSLFWGVSVFGMALGSPSFNIQFCLLIFAGELALCALHWNLLSLGWSLVSV